MCLKPHDGTTLTPSLFYVAEQPRYDTVYACEGKTLKIECNDGELIHLIRANYGRFSITICNDHGNTDWSVNCMSPKSLRVLHSRYRLLAPKCSLGANFALIPFRFTSGVQSTGVFGLRRYDFDYTRLRGSFFKTSFSVWRMLYQILEADVLYPVLFWIFALSYYN